MVAPEYVGVRPDYAPPEIQDKVMEAKTDVMYTKYGGDYRLMAVEHYAGEGGADSVLSSGVLPTNTEYSNGVPYPSQYGYVEDIMSRMGGGSSGSIPSFGGLDNAVRNSKDVISPNVSFPIIINPEVYKVGQQELEDRPFLDKLEDSFLNMWYENGTISALRMGLIKGANRSIASDSSWKPSDADMKLMDEMLGDNQVARNSVLLNADNQAQFLALLKTKKEDLDRQKRADETFFGLHSVIGGIGGMLLDPLNLIPFVGEGALLAKIGTRLGSKALTNIGAKRVYQILETGAAQGMINMADSYLGERYGINQANYAVAGLLGAAGGAGVRILTTMKHLGVKMDGEELTKIATQTKNAEAQAVQNAADMADSVVISTDKTLRTPDAKVEEVKSVLGVGKDKTTPSTNTQVTDKGTSIRNLLGIKEQPKGRSKARQKALSLGLKELWSSVSTVEDLVGKKASTLLRRAGLSKDASVADLLRVASENPDINNQVKKAAQKYHKRTYSDDVWEEYKLRVSGENTGNRNYAQYAMEALTDSNKANNLRLILEKNTGKKMTNEELRQTLKKILYEETGATYTEDGTLINNGARIRPESPMHNAVVHPEVYGIDEGSEDLAMEIKDTLSFSKSVSPEDLAETKQNKVIEEDLPDFMGISKEEQEAFQKETEFGSKTKREVEQESQIAFKSRVMQWIGRKLQDSKYLGNTYGHFTNSVSNHLRDFGRKFLADTRQNAGRLAEGMSLDFSTRKHIAYKELQQPLKKIADAYQSFYVHGKGGVSPQEAKKKFGKKLTEAYDLKVKKGQSISDFPEEIQEAVKYAEEFRKKEMYLMKRTGLIDSLIEDTGFYRSADVDKVAEFLTHFDNTDDAIKWLAEYAYDAADRTELEKMWKAEIAKRQEAMQKKMEHGTITPEEANYAQQTLDDFIREESQKWAYGIVDKNLSNAKLTLHDINHMDKLEQYQRRFPMDTAMVANKELPNGGGVWSFDDCMRDNDVVGIMDRIANRSSAKATMRSLGIEDMGKYFTEMRDKIERELRQASEQKKLINRKEVDEALEEYDYVVSQLTGYRFGTRKSSDPMGDIGRLMTKLSYSMNGYNMGLNQVNENMGYVSVTGVRAISHMIPGLDKILYGMRNSTLSLDEIKKLRIAGDYAHYSFLNPMDLRSSSLDRIGVRAKIMGKISDALDYTSDVTSMINRLSAMTDSAISMGEADVMSDIIDWAVMGKKSHLFEDRHLKAAGIRNAEEFKGIINKYFGNLDHDDPDAVFKAIATMQEENYQTYVSMRAFSSQAIQRGILQPTLSNANYFAKKGSMMPILFQFKNFSRMALDSHLARALEHPDKEAMTQLLSSGIAGAGIWALRTQVYANYKYKDEKERKEYLDKTLTPENFARAGITRSSLLAGLSYGNDLYEGVTGSATVRTTVNRQGQGDTIGDRINQLPAVGSIDTIRMGVGGAWSAMHDLVTDNRVYQDDAKSMTNMFPLDKFVGTQAVLGGLLDMQKGYAMEQFEKRPKAVETPNKQGFTTTTKTDTKKKKEKQKDGERAVNTLLMKGRW